MKTSVLGKLFRKFRTRDSRWRCQGQDARGLHSLRANIAQRARATPVTALRTGQNRLLQAGGSASHKEEELTRMDRIRQGLSAEEYPSDDKVADMWDEFLIGDSLLVAPEGYAKT